MNLRSNGTDRTSMTALGPTKNYWQEVLNGAFPRCFKPCMDDDDNATNNQNSLTYIAYPHIYLDLLRS